MSTASVRDSEISRSQAQPLPLRWWPAAVMSVLILALPYWPRMFEAPSIPIFMIGFLGPALVSIFVMIWWLTFSRATAKERLIGLAVYILSFAVSFAVSDASMNMFGALINTIPMATIAFVIPLVLLSSKPAVRLPVALICCGIVFGISALLRFEGTTGRFQSQLAWRWTKTKESLHLEKLAQSKTSTNSAGTDLAVPPITLASAQWPGFRGALRDGKQPGVVIDQDWKKSPPKQLWSTTIGPGWSSFAVADRFLFTQEQRGEREAVVCLNADTGQQVWAYEYESRFSEPVSGAGPRATPTIADSGLYTLGASGVLLCLDARTGDMKWRQELGKDAERQPPQWGYSSSPLVAKGLVVVHAGGKENKGVFAYDAQTGELKWSCPSGDHSYSSAQLATLDGVEGILMETNAGLQFVNTIDGKILWTHDWPLMNYRALQPLVIGQVIYLAGTLGQGIRKLSVTRVDGTWNVKEDWTSIKLKPDFNDFVEHQGFLYGFDGDILSCSDAQTGERMWKKGRYGNGQIVLLPDANQLLVSSEKGDLALVSTNPKEFVELAKTHAIEGKTWNHPVLIGDRVYLRNDQQAACFQVPLQTTAQ